MLSRPFEAEVFRRDEEGFAGLRNRRVLIYWPHGFGDWVFLSYLLPLLEPTNRYFVTRYGDDNTAVFDGSAWVTPLYVGQNSTHCRDGAEFGNAHFGLRNGERTGRSMRLALPSRSTMPVRGKASMPCSICRIGRSMDGRPFRCIPKDATCSAILSPLSGWQPSI